jgi:predicted metal-dependent hydrolase
MSNTSRIAIAGREVPVRFRANAAARRIILRIDTGSDGVVLTMPKWAREKDAMELLVAREDWVLARLDALPARIPFADGASVPLFDAPHIIRHSPERRGGVTRDGAEIQVHGRIEHLPRRLGEWLRSEARTEIAARAHPLADRIRKRIGRITVRDTISRWGSCSAAGNLSFSWRLVMAPGWIMDYVVAHEVAHLRHANHGPGFWELVDELGVDAKQARRWLNANAQRLQRIG